MPATGVRVSVVVPTYRRPEQLARCLAGLGHQERAADEVIVVRRAGDGETGDVLRRTVLPVTEVVVEGPGVLAALQAGSAAARGDVLAFTDDDAVPRGAWLARLLSHYGDPVVGGVGGRDIVAGDSSADLPSAEVGRVSPWGRTTGGHHLGSGPAVHVDLLKGVNMSFRRAAMALPDALRGQGAQVHNEMFPSLYAVRAGWRLVYDPEAVVDHLPGPRFDADGRDRRSRGAIGDEAYNLVAALLVLRPELRLRRAAFGLLVGDRATPGLLRALVALRRGEPDVLPNLAASLCGQSAAVRDAFTGRLPAMLPVTAAAADVPGRAPRRARDAVTVERVLRNVKEVAQAAVGGRLARRRLARRYVYNALRSVVPYVGMEGDSGLVFASTADRTVGKHVFMDGDWSPQHLPRALRLAGVDLTGRVFVEVGANIGTTTLQAARLAERVVAFEPEPLNYRLLRANVSGNGLDGTVVTVPAGCSREPGEAAMARSPVNWGDHRVSRAGDVPIRLVRLDDALDDLGVHPESVGFLWVDVQGHEASVLAGATRLLAARPALLVEYWPDVLGETLAELEHILAGTYTRFIDLDDGSPTTLGDMRARWRDGASDLLCLG